MNFLLIGCNGKMGKAVCEIASQLGDKISCGIDTLSLPTNFQLYDNIESVNEKPDSIIDFSTAQNHCKFINYAVKNNIPFGLFSTVYDEETANRIKTASRKIPILQCENASIGANVIFEMLNSCCKTLQGVDCILTEYHHKNKIDKPSGTAKNIQQILEKNRLNYTIHSHRVGNEVGRHTIEFFMQDEYISITHQAFSRNIFARGALLAMHKLAQKKKGLYLKP